MDTQGIAMMLISEAIARIPEADSLWYREAVVSAPQVVKRESDPARYLAVCNGDIAATANLLCRYWNERRFFFGNRAFFPLDLTGLGALTVDDIHLVRAACVAPLPNHSSGCSILAVDRSRICVNATREARVRALFYHLHHVSVNSLSQTEGFYILVRQFVSAEQEADPTSDFMAFGRLVNSHPIRVKALHMVAIVPLIPYGQHLIPMIEMNLLVAKQGLETGLNMAAKLHVVTAESKAGRLLEAEGFSLACMPSSMGGSWSYDYDFAQWWVSQLAADRVMIVNSVFGRASATGSCQIPVTPAQPSLPVSDEGPVITESFRIQERAVEGLQEAIQFLPAEKREAYLEALERCPNLVQSESNPIWFLQYENYDPWAAAGRLTTYWFWRKQIFRERAFLPIVMTGDGALSHEDIVHVRRAYFAIMRNDTSGSSVICYNPARRVHHSKETRMRVGFYLWTVICENEITRRDGYVGIVLLGTSGFGSSSLDGAIRECADMVQESFPSRCKNMHLVQCPRPGGRRTILQMALPLINYVMGRIMEGRAVTHVADTGEDMLASLSKYGIDARGLPDCAGGVWTFDNYYHWQLERCRIERQRHPVSSGGRRNATPEPLPAPYVTSGGALDGNSNRLIMEALRRVPDHEKAQALEAINNHSALAHIEAVPQRFVQCDISDISAAARRLCNYWSCRHSLFGKKTFQPLTQTGEGALLRSDMTFLATGCLSILPTKKDKPVIVCYDVSKHQKCDVPTFLRVAFYIFQVASENPISQTVGVVIIVAALQHVTESMSIELQHLLDALPIKVTTIHLTHIYSSDDEVPELSLDNSVSVLRRMFGKLGDEKAIVHLGHSKDELCEQLYPYGIQRLILPKSLGGSVGFDRFVQWQELRTRYEWGLPAGSNDHEATDAYDFSHIKPLSDLNSDERKERKRRMNVVHSRRKRERERIEIQVLQEQCSELKEDNRILLRDRNFLENLLSEAAKLVNLPVFGNGRCQHVTVDRKPPAIP